MALDQLNVLLITSLIKNVHIFSGVRGYSACITFTTRVWICGKLSHFIFGVPLDILTTRLTPCEEWPYG